MTTGYQADTLSPLIYGYWKRRFAVASDVAGRTFTLNGTTYAILGVAPPRFGGDVVG